MTLKLKNGETPSTEAPNPEETAEVQTEETPKAETPKVDEEKEALKAKLTKLEERLEEMASRPADAPQQPRVTSIQLRGLTEEAQAKISEQMGQPFNAILANVEAQERAVDESKRIAGEARVNVRDAIDDAVDADPQVAKLKGHIKDYLADVSDADKANPKRLERHMKKAITYARGAAGMTSRTVNGKARNETKGPGPDDAPVFDKDSDDDIKPGLYDDGSGFRLRIEDKMDADTRKAVKHPEHKHGVRISSDFDKPPKFR
jgi:hypothetical protein